MFNSRKVWLCGIVGVCSLAVATTLLKSQDGDTDHGGKKPAGMPDMAQMAEMMKKCEAAGKPGPNHKILDPLVGEWKTKTRMWMDPSMPPTESEGTASTKWIMDKRFLTEELNAEMVMPDAKGGMSKVPFHGLSTTGFDNIKNLYVGTWIDDMGTCILTMSGSYNPTTKTLSTYGKMDDLMMGVYGKMLRYDTKFVSNDKHVFTMYDCHAGPDYKIMEITYTRAK
ncbi:MAG TPA: DUF1579 domain-containing protein [Phycisphaerae bacterium]|nr:DUF1579 domain-containing protein [Phycisphaerae bacterium]